MDVCGTRIPPSAKKNCRCNVKPLPARTAQEEHFLTKNGLEFM